MHVVAGCVVARVAADGQVEIARVVKGQRAAFWGHYRVGPDGLAAWIADYSDRAAAVAAAKRAAGRKPVFVEVDGELVPFGIGFHAPGDAREEAEGVRAAAASVAEYERDGGVPADVALFLRR